MKTLFEFEEAHLNYLLKSEIEMFHLNISYFTNKIMIAYLGRFSNNNLKTSFQHKLFDYYYLNKNRQSSNTIEVERGSST